MTFLIHALVFSLGASDDVAQSVIKSQAEILAKIKSIHWKSEMFVQPSKHSTWKKVYSMEVWQDGTRQKESRRDFLFATPGGDLEYPEGKVSATSLTDKENRRLDGWDPMSSFPWYYNFANQKAATIQGVISDRHPSEAGFASELYDVFLQYSLAKLIKDYEVDSLPPDSSGNIKFEVKATKGKIGSGLFVGMTFEIATAHSFHISKWQRNRTSNEVEEFAEVAKGIWMPKRMRGESGQGASKTSIECEINVPIAAGDLALDFPEGASVDDRKAGVAHLWGRSGPARTFASLADLHSELSKSVMYTVIATLFAFVLTVATLLVWIRRRNA